MIATHTAKAPPKEPHSERGAALIIVLGLVALISSWAITAAYEDMLALRRAENSQNFLRAEQGSLSALALSVKALREDSKNSQIDELDEEWAIATPPFPVDDGSVGGSIIDSNRFLNLNALVKNDGTVSTDVEKQVKKLFVNLELDASLVDALIDWMDANDSGSAEDSAYYDRDYRVKNARLDRWDELRLVKGFTDEVVYALASVCTVREVPKSAFSAININTAPAEVLMAVIPTLTAPDAELLISGRPFNSVQQASQNTTWVAGLNQAYLSVSSDIFMVRTEARFGRVVLREKYMLRRASGKITVISAERQTRPLVVKMESM